MFNNLEASPYLFHHQYHQQRHHHFNSPNYGCNGPNCVTPRSSDLSTWRTFDVTPPPPPPPSPWSAVLYHPLCLYPSLYPSPNLDQINNWPTTVEKAQTSSPILSSSSSLSSSLNVASSESTSSVNKTSSSSSSCCVSDADESMSSGDDDSMSTFDDDEVAKNVVDSILNQSAAVESSSSSSPSNELRDITNSPVFGHVGNGKPRYTTPRFDKKWLPGNNVGGQFNQQSFFNFYPNPIAVSMAHKKQPQQRYQRPTVREQIDNNNRMKNSNENHDTENNNQPNIMKPHRRYQYSPMLNHPGFYNSYNTNNKPRFYFQRLNHQLPTAAVASGEVQFGSSKAYQNYSYAAAASLSNNGNNNGNNFTPYKNQNRNSVLKMRS